MQPPSVRGLGTWPLLPAASSGDGGDVKGGGLSREQSRYDSRFTNYEEEDGDEDVAITVMSLGC